MFNVVLFVFDDDDSWGKKYYRMGILFSLLPLFPLLLLFNTIIPKIYSILFLAICIVCSPFPHFDCVVVSRFYSLLLSHQ